MKLSTGPVVTMIAALPRAILSPWEHAMNITRLPFQKRMNDYLQACYNRRQWDGTVVFATKVEHEQMIACFSNGVDVIWMRFVNRIITYQQPSSAHQFHLIYWACLPDCVEPEVFSQPMVPKPITSSATREKQAYNARRFSSVVPRPW